MKWLVDVLTKHAHFDLEHAPSRELLAEAIIEAIPKDVVVLAIASSAGAVLKTRNIADEGRDLALEIARNSAQTVLTLLLAGEEPDEPAPKAGR